MSDNELLIQILNGLKEDFNRIEGKVDKLSEECASKTSVKEVKKELTKRIDKNENIISKLGLRFAGWAGAGSMLVLFFSKIFGG